MNRLVFALGVLLAMAVAAGVLYLVSRSSAPVPTADIRETPPAEPEPASASPSAPSAPLRTPEASRPAPGPAEPAAPTAGTLRVDSDVPGAQVFLDRKFVGETPVTARNVPPGSHLLNVEARGYDGVRQSLEVTAGEQELYIKLREVRLDTTIAVEHRHGVGSCRGQLVATPQGLRYEPTDGNHAFTVALTDLDLFEVDYLEKTLKVKPRGGRQYNFTDPEDSAERLMAFRQEVGNARDRLLQGDVPGPE